MFWQNFYELCIEFGSKPVNVVKDLCIAPGNVTAWKNGTIPNGDTLLKIADYFNCSVDYLLGRSDEKDGTLYSQKEMKIITAYRKNPEMQHAVDKLLGLDNFRITDHTKDYIKF